MPSRALDAVNRLNAICPYFTMFRLEFPLAVLAEARPGQWVLDPFCGRGTTLFAARTRGLGSVGIDTNPVAHALAQAKYVSVQPRQVIDRCRELLAGTEADIPDGEFWRWCFDRGTLVDICRLREGLSGASDPVSVGLRALILGILHGPSMKGAPTYLSNQMPRTYATKPRPAVRYWRERGLNPPKVDVLDAVSRRAIHVFSRVPPRSPGEAKLGDARTVLPSLRRRFSWVVTSPPYYGMRTYVSDQWLRLWFLGGQPTVTYESPSGQIGPGKEDEFVLALAQVWRAVAARCLPGARLVVRFGALPSSPRSPQELLLRSLREADVGWRVTRTQSAGQPRRAARQAHQMGRAGAYVEEIDLYARLAP
jgi:hypothetical protein